MGAAISGKEGHGHPQTPKKSLKTRTRFTRAGQTNRMGKITINWAEDAKAVSKTADKDPQTLTGGGEKNTTFLLEKKIQRHTKRRRRRINHKPK